jgi:hypothetical protein
MISGNLEKLESGLREALTQFRTDQRRSVVTALEAILDFIDSVPEWERAQLGMPLWALLAALKDLDSGRAVSMLSPDPNVRNRKPDSSLRKNVKAWAVICVDILIGACLSVMEACRFVAHRLDVLNVPVGGRTDTPSWKTVKGWRNGVTKLPPNDPAREVIDGLRKEIHALKFTSTDKAKEWAAGQLHVLIDRLGRSGLE